MQVVGCVIIGCLLSYVIEKLISIIYGKEKSIESNDYLKKFIISFITGVAVFLIFDSEDSMLYAGIVWGITDGTINGLFHKKG